MNVLKTLAAIGALAVAVVAWDHYRPEGGLPALVARTAAQARDSGFATIPMPDGVPARGVIVFAPPDCPSAAAQRAEALVGALSARGIRVQRASTAEYSQLDSREAAEHVMAVMNGPIPIVYVNGRAKANPTLDEVLAEYHRDGG